MSTLADESDGHYELGDLSLREALALANLIPGSDTIQFDASLFALGPAALTLAYDGPDAGTAPDSLSIDSAVTIQGPGADQLSISGNDLTRVLYVNSGVTATIEGVTIRDGNAGSNHGGGIFNAGNLTLESVVVTQNATTNYGGGIYNNNTIRINNSTVSENSALNGGGISSQTDVALGVVIENSAMIDNDATFAGGASFSRYNSSVTTGTARFTNSTVSGNEASGNAGGIAAVGGFGLTVVQSTVTNNRAGLVASDGVGGGFLLASSLLTLHNSIVAGNTADYSYHHDITGGWTDPTSSYNLIGVQGDSGLTNNIYGNLVGTYTTPLVAGLTLLGNYGGPQSPMRYCQLVSLSVRGNVSKAKDSTGNSLTHDQNGAGFERVLAGSVDIGALESHIVSIGIELLVFGTGLGDAISVRQDQIVIDRISTFDFNLSPHEVVWVYGLSGDDIIAVDLPPAISVEAAGEAGDDTLHGSGGNDALNGGPGNDVIYGGSGNDGLSGADGNDLLFGESGNDQLHGQNGDDQLFGGEGTDNLVGGGGDDLLDSGTGEDSTNGGDGVDHVDGAATDNLSPWIVWMGNPTVDLLDTPSIQLKGGTIFDVQVHAVDPEGDFIYYGLQAFDDQEVEILLSSIGSPSIVNGRLTWNVRGQTTTQIENIKLRVSVSDQPPGGGAGSSESSGSATADIDVEVTPVYGFADSEFDLGTLYPLFENYHQPDLQPGEIGLILGPTSDIETGAPLTYTRLEGPGSIGGNEWTWEMGIGDFATSHKVVFSVSKAATPQGSEEANAIGIFYIKPRGNYQEDEETFHLYAPPLAKTTLISQALTTRSSARWCQGSMAAH